MRLVSTAPRRQAATTACTSADPSGIRHLYLGEGSLICSAVVAAADVVFAYVATYRSCTWCVDLLQPQRGAGRAEAGEKLQGVAT